MKTVKMLKTAQFGGHYAKKGDKVSVPADVADHWIAIKAATESK